MTAREASPRLGRGLAALLGDAAASTADSEGVRAIAIERLEPGPYQPREPVDPQSLEDLAASIRARGILQPLLARPHPTAAGRFQIVAGERRWRAAQMAGLHEVPALVRTLADAEAMAAALVENLQRRDLNPIEEAMGYRRLMTEFAMTQEMLGDAVGKSRSHVANIMRLLNLPQRVQAEVRTGALSAGHARALLAHPDPERAALAVIARGLSVRQTEALAARQTDIERDSGRRRDKDPDTVALERQLAAHLGLKVDIVFDGQQGALRLHFRTPDQLEGLTTRLMQD